MGECGFCGSIGNEPCREFGVVLETPHAERPTSEEPTMEDLYGPLYATLEEARECFEKNYEYADMAYAESGGALNLPRPVWNPDGVQPTWNREFSVWNLPVDTVA